MLEWIELAQFVCSICVMLGCCIRNHFRLKAPTGYAVLLNNIVQIKTVHPGSRSEVIGLVLTWRPGFKSLSGHDCKYGLVNIRSISQNKKGMCILVFGSLIPKCDGRINSV